MDGMACPVPLDLLLCPYVTANMGPCALPHCPFAHDAHKQRVDFGHWPERRLRRDALAVEPTTIDALVVPGAAHRCSVVLRNEDAFIDLALAAVSWPPGMQVVVNQGAPLARVCVKAGATTSVTLELRAEPDSPASYGLVRFETTAGCAASVVVALNVVTETDGRVLERIRAQAAPFYPPALRQLWDREPHWRVIAEPMCVRRGL